MLSEPKFKHNLLTKDGQWVAGANDWAVISMIKGRLMEQDKEQGLQISYRVITFHP